MKNEASIHNDIFWFTRFDPDGQGGGGGYRREKQLLHVLSELHPRIFSSRHSRFSTGELSIYRQWIWKLHGKFHPFLRYWADQNTARWSLRMHAAAGDWKRSFPWKTPPRMAFIDDPLYFSPLVRRLSHARIPIAAMCQNLESLGRDQLNPRFQRRLLNRELNLLSRCSLLITISREEQFLLRNLDLPAVYFPYYPVPEEVGRLTAIRNRRKGKKKSHFLLLGTAGNQSTRNGMLAIIKKWKDTPVESRQGERLLVSGYWTRLLGNGIDGDGVDYLGEITDARLAEILETTRALICFQKHGGGALTRVADALLAGVPVLGNDHALRTWYGSPGMRMYSSPDCLVEGAIKLISEKELTVPSQPVRQPDPGPLKECILSILAQSTKGDDPPCSISV